MRSSGFSPVRISRAISTRRDEPFLIAADLWEVFIGSELEVEKRRCLADDDAHNDTDKEHERSGDGPFGARSPLHVEDAPRFRRLVCNETYVLALKHRIDVGQCY